MTMREKIIAFLSLLSIIYGVYHFSFPYISFGPSPMPRFGEPDLNAFIRETTAAVIDGKNTEKYRSILSQLDADGQNPFWEQEASIPQSRLNPQNLPLYSGCLIMGNKKFAIINGAEYAIGEILDPGGNKILDISPTHVLINSDGEDPMRIPLVDIY